MPVFRTTVRLAFSAGVGGGTNTWHFRTNGALNSGQLAEVRSALLAFYTAVMPQVPASYSATWDGYVAEIATGSPTVQELGAPFTANGSGGANYGPAASMACVTWRSTLANRRGRGRTFVGPLSVTAIQGDGTLATATLTALRGAATTLVNTSASANGWGMGVWSEADSVLRDFVAATVTDEVAVLRSRRS